MGVLVLVLAAVLIIPAMTRDGGKEAVEDLFTALAESDAYGASELSVESTYNVTDEMLRRSNEIAPIELKSVENAGDGRYTVVYTLGPNEHRATVRAIEEYDSYKIDDVTTRVNFTFGDGYVDATVNGESAYGDMHLYPGTYDMAVNNDNVQLNPSQFVVDLAEPTIDVAPEVLASDAGREAAKGAIWERIEDCAEYASADTDGCPMKIDEGENTIVGVDWSVEENSLEVEELDGAAEAYTVKATVTASATYTEYAADSLDDEDKSITDEFSTEMVVDLTGPSPRVEW